MSQHLSKDNINIVKLTVKKLEKCPRSYLLTGGGGGVGAGAEPNHTSARKLGTL